jgi:formate hydrogenlyase subunit 3/multisubunit Na+/H+ antiporter MnhD subunit
MSFAVVLEGMTFVALVVLMSGGRLKRESGWKVLSFLLVLGGIVQLASVAIIVSTVECWEAGSKDSGSLDVTGLSLR